MSKTLRIAISIPNEGLTKSEAYDSHILWAIHLGIIQERSRLENWEEQLEFHFFSVGRLLTAFAREQLVKHALAGGMDYICMLDDDMVIFREQIDILERLLAHKVDIVAPLAFTRGGQHLPVMYETTKGYDPVGRTEYGMNNFIKNYPKNALVECDAVGFGMVLIDCKVLEKLEAPYFMSTTGAGEDVWFCMKAGRAGCKVFMDTSLKLGHLGAPRLITEETYEAVNDPDSLREKYGTYRREGYISPESVGKNE